MTRNVPKNVQGLRQMWGMYFTAGRWLGLNGVHEDPLLSFGGVMQARRKSVGVGLVGIPAELVALVMSAQRPTKLTK